MKKNKKKVIVIFSSIFALILIGFTIINSFESFHFTNNLFFGKTSNNKKISEKYNNIDEIYIEVDNAIINLINVESDEITVELYSDKDNVKVKSYNKKLSIMSENRVKCIFCTLNVINVYASKDFKEYINIINDYGHINIDSFELASVSINNKFGNVEIKNANMLKVITGRGDVNIKKVNNVSLQSNWGNAYINSANIVNVDSKFSNIEIDTINQCTNMQLDFGNISINSANIAEKSIINNSCGNVFVENLEEKDSYLEINEQFSDLIKKNN